MIKDFFNKYNIDFKENVSLKRYNTFRIDTLCDFLVFPNDVDELKLILNFINENKIKYFILGNGSNVIFADNHYKGIIIKLDKFNNIEYSLNEVTVGAGYSLIRLAMDTIEKGYSGFEFACGIPGSVGASVAMNAGAYKCDMSDIVKKIVVLVDGKDVIELSKNDMNYEYRDSIIKNNDHYIVLSTTFNLSEGDPLEMKKIVEERRIKRLDTQPLNYPSAGSVFRNPKNMFAGELIENSNLKGYSINDAEISLKHANFIINKGHASGKDIINLINKIQKEVKENYNVELKLEQIIVK